MGFRWSTSGPLDDMRCVKIDMPSKPARYSWNDNYLCLPHESVYKLHWSTKGPLPNKACLKITEPRDWFWRRANAYLCAEATSIGRNVAQHHSLFLYEPPLYRLSHFIDRLRRILNADGIFLEMAFSVLVS